MAYASYEFYQNIYGGVDIPLEKWLKLSRRADSVINQFTFDRLLSVTNFVEDVSLACCAVAEALYLHDAEFDRYHKEVKSENVDGYSVTLESSADTTIRHRSEIANAIDTYLPRSHHLRYRGV